MTTAEFIAWFQGFTARIKGRPSQGEWDEILARVAQLDGAAPLKSWFDGLRMTRDKRPDEKIWQKIMAHVAEVGEAAAGKKRSLQNLFESFEQNSDALARSPSEKARGIKHK